MKRIQHSEGVSNLELAISAEGDGDLPKAIALFKTVLDKTPDSPQAMCRLARIKLKMGLLDEAKNYALRSFQLQKDNPIALSILGRVAMVRFQDDDALDWFGRVPPAAKEHADALFQIARLHRKKGDTSAAIDTLKRAVASYPDRQSLKKALHALETQDSDEADTASQPKPEEPQATPPKTRYKEELHRAIELEQNDDFIGAKQALEDLLKDHQPSVDTFFRLARVSMALNDIDGARDYQERATILDPLHIKNTLIGARVARALGDMQAENAHLELAQKLGDDTYGTKLSRARVLERSESFKELESVLEAMNAEDRTHYDVRKLNRQVANRWQFWRSMPEKPTAWAIQNGDAFAAHFSALQTQSSKVALAVGSDIWDHIIGYLLARQIASGLRTTVHVLYHGDQPPVFVGPGDPEVVFSQVTAAQTTDFEVMFTLPGFQIDQLGNDALVPKANLELPYIAGAALASDPPYVMHATVSDWLETWVGSGPVAVSFLQDDVRTKKIKIAQSSRLTLQNAMKKLTRKNVKTVTTDVDWIAGVAAVNGLFVDWTGPIDQVFPAPLSDLITLPTGQTIKGH